MLGIALATTNSVPKSMSQSKARLIRGAGAAAAAVGGYALKQFLDGPDFTEVVSLEGKNVAITGANVGLGYENALAVAKMSANVYLLCRSREKGLESVQKIKEASKNDNVFFVQCDLADLKSIDKCSNELRSILPGKRIDVLVNNAGVMAIPTRELTNDGFEKQMGINHLGHFALSAKVFDLLKNSKSARIINVSSSAHLFGKGSSVASDFMLEKESAYAPWLAYGNSKLCNILFTKELQKKIEQKGYDNINAYTLHPGGVRTELGRYLIDKDHLPIYAYPLIPVLGGPLLYFTKSPQKGAQTQIFLSASQTIGRGQAGSFFDNSVVADTSSDSKDASLMAAVWAKSEALTNIKFSL